MTRSQKKNGLIVLLSVTLLVLLYCILELGQRDQQSAAARIMMADTDAETIIIQRSNTTLEFQRGAAGWRMLKPHDQPANEQRLTPLLSLLTLPSSHRYEIADVDQSKLGLNPAQASVRINNLEFVFGRTDAAGYKRYLQVDNAVYLVDDLIFPLINSTAESFIAVAATE